MTSQVINAQAALSRSELDKGLSYRCTTCNYIHTLEFPPPERCRAGRNMRDEGCNGTQYVQGNHWFREGTSSWDRGCWHFVHVAKGQDPKEAIADHCANLQLGHERLKLV